MDIEIERLFDSLRLGQGVSWHGLNFIQTSGAGDPKMTNTYKHLNQATPGDLRTLPDRDA